MISKVEQAALATSTESTGKEQEQDWPTVFRKEFPRIYNYLRYRLGNEDLAEDLAAETFARAWRSRRHYEADLSAFSTWLFTIARNLIVDHFRRRNDEVDLAAAENVAGPEMVESQVQRRQDEDQLRQLLQQLPPREQEIIACRYGAEMSYREIGRLMNLSVVNVRVILFRTVRLLRAQWED